jgi:hypothetical protein
MHIDENTIQGEVYAKTEKGIYYVKVTFPELHMYINSITVRQSTKYPDGELWVQMPAFRIGSRWVKPLEFSSDSQLLILIKDAALRAVDAYNISTVFPDPELENIDEALDKAIDDFTSSKPP